MVRMCGGDTSVLVIKDVYYPKCAVDPKGMCSGNHARNVLLIQRLDKVANDGKIGIVSKRNDLFVNHLW